jgi:hypothetical protein
MVVQNNTRTPTGETPFSLTFGTEVVIPIEVGSLSYHVEHYNPGRKMGSSGRNGKVLISDPKDRVPTTSKRPTKVPTSTLERQSIEKILSIMPDVLFFFLISVFQAML